MEIWRSALLHALSSQILEESERGVRANWNSSSLSSPTASENGWTVGFHYEQVL